MLGSHRMGRLHGNPHTGPIEQPCLRKSDHMWQGGLRVGGFVTEQLCIGRAAPVFLGGLLGFFLSVGPLSPEVWFKNVHNSHLSSPLYLTFTACFASQCYPGREARPAVMMLIFLKIYFIEVHLIYNVVLVSAVQQSHSVMRIYISFFILFSIMVWGYQMQTIVHRTVKQQGPTM